MTDFARKHLWSGFGIVLLALMMWLWLWIAVHHVYAAVDIHTELEDLEISCSTLLRNEVQLLPPSGDVADVVIFYPAESVDYYYVVGLTAKETLKIDWWGASLSYAREQCQRANSQVE